MGAELTILVGPAHSGKTAAVWRAYLEQLAAGKPGEALWLAPNRRAVAQFQDRLARELPKGCLEPGCYTFAQYADRLLAGADLPIRPLDKLAKRQILWQIVTDANRAGELDYYAPIAAGEGFLAWVDELISDLKRQEIWPEDFAAAIARTDAALGRAPRAKDRELARLYAEYQRRLNAANCYDAEGRFWSAREELRQWGEEATAPRLIVADGFTDFTRAQHEILAQLAARCERMFITLPGEEPPARRGDLFNKPFRTLGELQTRHPKARVEVHPRADAIHSNRPVLAHLEEHLFTNPRHTPPPVTPAGLEIWDCSSELGELEQLAREIKRLLLTGDAEFGEARIAPQRIAVVFRSLTTIAPLVREVFTEYGLPFALEVGQPLAEAPLPLALTRLLSLHLGDWPFRGLLQVLANGYITPQGFSARDWLARGAAEGVVRELQLVSGRDELLRAVQRGMTARANRLAEAEAENLPDREQRAASLARWTAAEKYLRKLAEPFVRLPAEATWREWAALLTAFAERLGVLNAAARGVGKADGDAENANSVGQGKDHDAERLAANGRATVDLIAWRQLLAALRSAARVEQWQNQPERKLSVTELLAELQLVGQAQSLPPETDGVGRVQVLAAPNARVGEWDYLFLAGLAEKVFPAAGGTDRLYSLREAQDLNSQGLRFVSSREWASEELLLFYEIVTRAMRRLTLSYPALDEKAESLAPSPYVIEVRRACGLAERPSGRALDLSPVPAAGEPVWSRREWRIRAVASALAGDVSQLARVERAGATLLHGLKTIAARVESREFGPFEGRFPTVAAQGALDPLFGDQHCWSTSQLEKYATCPFLFFAERVLRIVPLAELSFESDHLLRGTWLHAALAHLHRELNAAGETVQVWIDRPADYAAACERVLTVTEPPGDGGALAATLREIDRRFLGRWLRNYAAQLPAFLELNTAKLQPLHFEVAFGPGKATDHVDPLCTSAPWEFSGGELRLRLSGQIDRIDVGIVNDKDHGSRPIFRIVDYKSGAIKPFKDADLLGGNRLQLPLYALAVEQLLLEKTSAVAWEIGYWGLKRVKDGLKIYPLAAQSEGQIKTDEMWQLNRIALQNRVAALARGVQRGEFPMINADTTCTSRCEFKTVCRVGQTRSLEKQWTPPLAPPTASDTATPSRQEAQS